MRFEQPHDAERAREGRAFFESALGRDLERVEMQAMRQHVDDCFGARGVLLGPCGDQRLLDALKVQRRVAASVAPGMSPRCAPVNASQRAVIDPCNLPFGNAVFDVVVMFHGLDLAANPQQALREAGRVLSDGGRLLLTGFNPYSLWGARRWFGRRGAPWNSNFISPWRMMDWLALLDITVTDVEYLRFRPPWLGGERVFDSDPARWLRRWVQPPLGGVYMIKAWRRPAQGVGEGSVARRKAPIRAIAPVSSAGRHGPRAARETHDSVPGKDGPV